jgi:hypothetical protein
MAGAREAVELVEHDHESQVQVGTRRIDAEFDAQRSAGSQPLLEVHNGLDVIETVEQLGGVQTRNSTIVTPVEPSSSLP